MVLPRCERTSSVAQTDGLRNVVKQARTLRSISCDVFLQHLNGFKFLTYYEPASAVSGLCSI